MTKYQDKLGRFAERLKSDSTEAPLQEVKPIVQKVTPKTETEVQLNVWIPKSLMKKVKQKSIDNDKTLKDLVTEAVILYLDKR